MSEENVELAWLPPHRCGLHLTHNGHRDYYESVEQWDEHRETDWVSDAERAKAIATDEVWVLQWYPDTPIGSYSIAASTLEAIRDSLAQPEPPHD